MKSRQEIKSIARQQMAMQRGTAILLGLMLSVIGFVSGAIDQIVGWIFGTWSPIYLVVYFVGYAIIMVAGVNMIGEFIKIYRGETVFSRKRDR